MRPYTEYADRKYLRPDGVAHIVPWGNQHALCGLFASDWFGTGDWHETEHAAWMPLCDPCHQAAYPKNSPKDRDPAVETWRSALQHTH